MVDELCSLVLEAMPVSGLSLVKVSGVHFSFWFIWFAISRNSSNGFVTNVSTEAQPHVRVFEHRDPPIFFNVVVASLKGSSIFRSHSYLNILTIGPFILV